MDVVVVVLVLVVLLVLVDVVLRVVLVVVEVVEVLVEVVDVDELVVDRREIAVRPTLDESVLLADLEFSKQPESDRASTRMEMFCVVEKKQISRAP